MNSVTQSQSGQKQFEAALFSHSLFKDPRPPKTADAVAPSSPFTNTPEYEPNLAEHINEIRQAVRRACVRQRRTGTLDLSSAYESLQKLVKDPIPLPESNLELAEQIGMFHRVMTEYCAPIGRYFHLQIQNVMSPLGDLENAAGVTEALLDNNQWRRYPTVAGDVWLNNISLLSSSLSYMGFTDRNFAFPCRRSAQLVGEGLYEKLEADDEDQLKSAKSLLKLLHAFGVSKQDFGSLYGVPRSHYTQIQIAADYLYVRRLGQIKNHPQMQNEIVNNKIAGLQLLPESSPLLAFDAQSHRYSASMELGVVARIMSGQIGGALREIQHHLSGPHPERAFLSALSYICDLQMTVGSTAEKLFYKPHLASLAHDACQAQLDFILSDKSNPFNSESLFRLTKNDRLPIDELASSLSNLYSHFFVPDERRAALLGVQVPAIAEQTTTSNDPVILATNFRAATLSQSQQNHLDRLRSIRQSAEVRKEQLAVAKTFDSMLQKITDFEHCYTQIRLQAAHLWSLITPDGQENFNQLAQDPNEEVHSETLIRLPEFFRPPHQSYEEILSKLLVPYARELSALRRSCKAISNVLKAAPKTTAFSQLEERISNFTYLQDLGNQAAMASGFRGPLESDIIMLSKAVDRISSFKVQKEAFSDKGILNDPASAVLTTLRGVVLDGAVSALNDQAVIQANFLVFSTCLSVTFAGLIFREAEKDAIVFAQVKNELARLQHQKLRNVLSDQFLRLDPSIDPKVFQKTRMEQFNRERLELVGGPLGLCLLEILQAHQQDTLASNSEHFKRRLARFKVADQHDPRIVPLLSQHMTGPLFSEEAAQQFADQVLPLVFFDPNREVPISADAIDPDEQAFVTQVLIDDYHVDDKIAAQIASSLTMTSVQDIISAVSETFASISFPPNAASTWLTNNVKFWNLPNKQQKQHLSRIEEVYSKVWSSNLASLPYYSDLDARIGDLGLRTLEILAKKVDRNLHGLD